MSNWFGKNWGARVCKAEDNIQIPIGESCLYCKEIFIDEDQGISMPSVDGLVSYHLNCFLRTIIGSENHIRMGPHKCGSGEGDSELLTKRQAANAAVKAWKEHAE